MRVLLVIALLPLLCACTPASIILLSARDEYQILNPDSTRKNVEKYLGRAISEKAINPPVALKEFPFPKFERSKNSRFTNHQVYYSLDYTPSADELQLVAGYCRYEAKGKIVPHGYAGDAIAMTLMTAGLGEIIALPMAISEVTPDSTIENRFDVWYSTQGKVLAYYWAWTSTKTEEKRDNPGAPR